MTWYANEIILNSTPKAREVLKTYTVLHPHIYELQGAPNAGAPTHRHDYSAQGLLVLRPVAKASSHEEEWYEADESLLKAELMDDFPQDTATINADAFEDIDGGFLLMRMANILAFCKQLSSDIGGPVCYFETTYWGGQIEYELGCVFDGDREAYLAAIPESPTVCNRSEKFHGEPLNIGKDAPDQDDILRRVLIHLGCRMDSGFFTPHTRGFEWDVHRAKLS